MVRESNRKITLKSRPDGYPELSDFELVEEPIPQPREGEVLIQSLWLSLDPLHARTNARRRVLCAFRAAWR